MTIPLQTVRFLATYHENEAERWEAVGNRECAEFSRERAARYREVAERMEEKMRDSQPISGGHENA